MMQKVEKIDIDLLIENPEQPRVNYGNLEELAKSIKTHGQIHPIKVSRIKDSDKMYIVAGHRRTKASKIAGLKTVDAVVVDEMSVDDLKAIAVAENLHRRQLTPAETAIAIKELYKENPDYKKQEIASILAISKSAVINYVKALKLPDDIFNGLTELGVGRDILLFVVNLSTKKYQEKALNILQQNPKTTIDVLKNLIDHKRTKKSFNIVVKPTSMTIFFGTTLTKNQQVDMESEIRVAIANFVKKNKEK